jgi:hypothetical protein
MAETGNFTYAKGPAEFVYGDDFDLFWERFQAFLSAAKCEKKAEVGLFKSFLDDRCFRRVQAITFDDTAHKTDGNIDLTKIKALIKAALAKEPPVPESISLKFKVQGPSEGIIEFGDEIRLLGQKIYGNEQAETNRVVIESFCAGISDHGIAAKMLQKKFENLTGAINFAVSRKETLNIKNALSQQRSTASHGGNVSVLPLDREGTVTRRRSESGSSRETGVGGRMGSSSASHETRVCYGCQKMGHISRDCPSGSPRETGGRMGSSSASQETRVCYGCQKMGHILRDCRVSGSGQRQNFQRPNTGIVVCHYCNMPGHIRRDCWKLQASQGRAGNVENYEYVPNQRDYQPQNFQGGPGFPRGGSAPRGGRGSWQMQ